MSIMDEHAVGMLVRRVVRAVGADNVFTAVAVPTMPPVQRPSLLQTS